MPASRAFTCAANVRMAKRPDPSPAWTQRRNRGRPTWRLSARGAGPLRDVSGAADRLRLLQNRRSPLATTHSHGDERARCGTQRMLKKPVQQGRSERKVEEVHTKLRLIRSLRSNASGELLCLQ